MRVRICLALSLVAVSALPACSSGSSGGGGGGDAEAALAAIGFTPGDLADMATSTMAVGLDWLTNDGVVPTARFGDSCPSFVPGTDDDLNGHPDTLEVTFDCTNLEGFVIAGSLFLSEYPDPQEFVKGTLSCSELLVGAGLAEWGMQGTLFVTIQEPGGTAINVNGGVDFAEFPDLGQLVMEIHTSIPGYPVDGGNTVDVSTNLCCTLPTDDSTDFPSGFIDTFVFDGPPPALLALECVPLPNGTIGFDAFNGETLLGSGIINLAAGDGDEVTFD